MFVNFLPQAGSKGDFAKTGTKLVKTEIDKILEYCSKMEPAPGKHQNGSIFPYTSQDFVGIQHETAKNGGLLFMDFDNLNKSDADTIFNGFGKITAKAPWVYAAQYSSSYFLKPDEKCGLHFYISTIELDYEQYAYASGLAYAYLTEVIRRELGIDLRKCGLHGAKVIDTHSSKLSQRLFLYHSPYQRNEWCSKMDPEYIESKTLDYLKKEYPEYMPKTHRLRKELSDTTKFSVETGALQAIPIKHGDRWVVVDTLFTCGWTEEQVLDTMLKIYKSETGKSDRERESTIRGLFNKAKTYKLSQSQFDRGRRILEKAGVVVTQHKDGIEIPVGKRIYDFRKEILDFISKNRRALIEAGTGTGKTTLINGSSEWNVPSLASELNAVVVVPYLANNKLYDSMVEVSSLNGNAVPADRPCVMVIDQAMKHFSEIKNRTIIIDESHQLFLDRSFRERAAMLMLELVEFDSQIICFTATPTGEVDYLGLEKMKFYNHRKSIRITLQDTDSIDLSELQYINAAIKNNWYDRVVLFDSHSAKKIYEYELVSSDFINDIAYLRSETKGTDVFNEVCDTQTLTKKLTICTPVAFNGLNFNNSGERILVVGSIRKNDTTPAEIIQYLGRVRESEVTAMLFYNSEEVDNSQTVEELRDKAVAYDDLIRRLNVSPNPFVGLYDTSLLEKKFADAKISVDQYRRKYSDHEKVMDGLTEWDYIQVSVASERWSHCKDTKHGVPQLRLKKKMVENDNFIRLMREGEDVLEYDFPEDYIINYKADWQKKLKEVLQYEGVTIQTVLDMIDSKKKGVLVETILDDINEICRITSINEEEWKKYLSNVDRIKAQLQDQYVKEFMHKHKKNIAIRNKYIGKIYKQDQTVSFTDIFDEIIREQETMTEEANKKRGEGGKKNAKTIKFKTPAYLPAKLKPFGGKKFSSCSEAAAAIGCSDDTITNYLRRGYCVEL